MKKQNDDNTTMFLDIFKKGRKCNTNIFPIEGEGRSVIEGIKKLSKEGNLNMIKLSELKDEAKVIDENLSIYTVEEVKNDLEYFQDKDKKFYTTTEYHASIDAESMLESAIESEYDNMY